MAHAGSSKNAQPDEWGTTRPKSAVVSVEEIILDGKLELGGQGYFTRAYVPLFGICAAKILLGRAALVADMEVENTRELVAAQELAHHPNIVDFYGKIEGTVKGKKTTIGFFSELMEGGNLFQVMSSLINEDLDSYFKMAARWSVQVARALAFCHSQKVIHRDIKIENLLLTADHKTIKICDFGLSRPDTGTSKHKTCNKGTLLYMAPEVIGEEGNSSKYGASVDVYSFGMYLYAVYNRKHPFQEFIDSNVNTLQFKRNLTNEKNPLRPKCDVQLPAEIKNIMERCWDTNPSKRPTMKEVAKELEQYWRAMYPSEMF